jgi:hypothetical protein
MAELQNLATTAAVKGRYGRRSSNAKTHTPRMKGEAEERAERVPHNRSPNRAIKGDQALLSPGRSKGAKPMAMPWHNHLAKVGDAYLGGNSSMVLLVLRTTGLAGRPRST